VPWLVALPLCRKLLIEFVLFGLYHLPPPGDALLLLFFSPSDLIPEYATGPIFFRMEMSINEGQ
jgi:hypothetical protein